MPWKPKKPCCYPGCPELVDSKQRYCEKHKKQVQSEYNKQRDKSVSRLYNHRWKKLRKLFLNDNPLCVECKKNGILKSATVVDHITPHKGNERLFWNSDNWQALCKPCHDSKTAKQDGRWG